MSKTKLKQPKSKTYWLRTNSCGEPCNYAPNEDYFKLYDRKKDAAVIPHSAVKVKVTQV